MKLSEHFTFEELTDSSSYPALVANNRADAQNYIQALTVTAYGLEDVRALVSAPLIVSSGYRNEALNEAVDGADNSGHKKGECGDVSTASMSYSELFSLIMANSGKVRNLYKCIEEGVHHKQWVHLQFKNGYTDKPMFYATTDGKNYERVA